MLGIDCMRCFRRSAARNLPRLPPRLTNLSGRWDVSLEFFSSKSQHTLYLTQDGNRIQGSHKGEFSTRDIFGTIEGDQIKLRSQHSEPGDSVGFIFDGTLAGDTLLGAHLHG